VHSLIDEIVLGDRKSIRQIADEFTETYGRPAQLERLGSLPELYETMQKRLQNDSSNVAAWMPLLVTPKAEAEYHYPTELQC
jgi:hypothetical protein